MSAQSFDYWTEEDRQEARAELDAFRPELEQRIRDYLAAKSVLKAAPTAQAALACRVAEARLEGLAEQLRWNQPEELPVQLAPGFKKGGVKLAKQLLGIRVTVSESELRRRVIDKVNDGNLDVRLWFQIFSKERSLQIHSKSL